MDGQTRSTWYSGVRIRGQAFELEDDGGIREIGSRNSQQGNFGWEDVAKATTVVCSI